MLARRRRPRARRGAGARPSARGLHMYTYRYGLRGHHFDCKTYVKPGSHDPVTAGGGRFASCPSSSSSRPSRPPPSPPQPPSPLGQSRRLQPRQPPSVAAGSARVAPWWRTARPRQGKNPRRPPRRRRVRGPYIGTKWIRGDLYGTQDISSACTCT